MEVWHFVSNSPFLTFGIVFFGVILGMFIRSFIQGREIFLFPPKLLKRDAETNNRFKISLAYPKLLSKRYSSSFIVQIFIPELKEKVTQKIHSEFGERKSEEIISESELSKDDVIIIKFYCPSIEFSDAVTKKLTHNLNSISFVGKPKDDCYPGSHQATMSITDANNGNEYQSITFQVKIVDYAFGCVPRPLLSNVMTVILGIGSLSMFILTLLGQIDTTFGLTSGTTAGAIATAIYFRFLSIYQRASFKNQP